MAQSMRRGTLTLLSHLGLIQEVEEQAPSVEAAEAAEAVAAEITTAALSSALQLSPTQAAQAVRV
eukprot:2638500-Prymnesium_polylepis.1